MGHQFHVVAVLWVMVDLNGYSKLSVAIDLVATGVDGEFATLAPRLI
jgi:hypothetical protein